MFAQCWTRPFGHIDYYFKSTAHYKTIRHILHLIMHRLVPPTSPRDAKQIGDADTSLARTGFLAMNSTTQPLRDRHVYICFGATHQTWHTQLMCSCVSKVRRLAS